MFTVCLNFTSISSQELPKVFGNRRRWIHPTGHSWCLHFEQLTPPKTHLNQISPTKLLTALIQTKPWRTLMLSRFLQKYDLKMKKPSAIGCRSSLYSSTTHRHPSDLHIHTVGVKTESLVLPLPTSPNASLPLSIKTPTVQYTRKRNTQHMFVTND